MGLFRGMAVMVLLCLGCVVATAQTGEEDEEEADVTCSLIATEVCNSNIDQTVDFSFNYGSWLELYNTSDKRLSLDFLYVSDDPEDPGKFQLPVYGLIPAHGYKCIFFDHNKQDGTYGPDAAKQVRFKLKQEGGTIYLSRDGETLFLQVDYPAAVMRCSWARVALDSDEWGYNGLPTPAAENSAATFASERLPKPVTNVPESQFFTSAIDVQVNIPAGATLRYTTDGSTPTLENGATSKRGSFHITKTTCLRLRFFQDGYLPSAVLTNTYLLRDADYYLPTVCITTQPENLYDDKLGVYVDGTNGVSGRNHGASNLNMDWERPVNVEYLDASGRQVLNQEAEFTVSGGWSRHFAPASFKLKASKAYEGQNSFDYPFFSQRKYKKYKQLLFRNGGNDNDNQRHGRVRDAITQQVLISNGFNVDAQDYQPCHVFFNGAYIGMLNLREPNNKYNGTASYGYDDDEMDAFEYSNGYFQMAGTKEAFSKWVTLSRRSANAETYQEIRELVDVDEVINYFAAIAYIGCSDWILNNNNLKGYRSRPDGKFHLTLLDQDWGWSATDGVKQMNGSTKNEILQIYNGMRRNPDFCRQFVDAYCLLAGSVFTRERCDAIGDSICELVAPALALEKRSPWASFYEQRGRMIGDSYTRDRLNNLRQAYALRAAIDVTLKGNVPQASLMLNNLPIPDAKFAGQLFPPCTITASAPAGFVFQGWYTAQSVDRGEPVTTDCRLELTSASAGDYVAVFKPVQGANPIRINEVSAANDIYVSDYFKRDDWVELYNVTDTDIDLRGMYISDNADKPRKYQIQAPEGVSTVVPAHGRLVVWADKRESITQLHLPFKLDNADGAVLALTAEDGSWTDVLRYNAHDGRESFGRYPDGGNSTYNLHLPTIERANVLSTYDFDFDSDFDFDQGGREQSSTFALVEGWNWFSHNMANRLQAAPFLAQAQELRSQQGTAVKGDDGKWDSPLSALSPAAGYKIKAGQDCQVSVQDYLYDVRTPVAVQKGWNWIGVPLANATVLPAALGDYQPTEGDVITSQTAFAIYTDGAWEGTLTSLQPGQAYMLYCGRAQAFCWQALTESRRTSRRYENTLGSDEEIPWTSRPQTQPDVMNIVARWVGPDDVSLPEGQWVGVFCADECRGAAQVRDGLLFLTVHGEEAADLTFQLVDDDGQPQQAQQQVTFQGQSLLGSCREPFLLTGTGDTPVQSMAQAGRIVSTQYYSTDGQLLARPLRGVTVVREMYENGKIIVRKVLR